MSPKASAQTYDFSAGTYSVAEGDNTSTTTVVTVNRSGGGGSTTVNGSAIEGGVVTLNAPPGHVFTAVQFASYGLPNGTPGSYTIDPGCHSATSVAQVEAVFLGQTSGSIDATNAVFGDPCPGIQKRLYITLVATSGGPSSVDVLLNAGAVNGATPGTDFTAGPVTVNFGTGEMSKSVPIEILGDTVAEADETIALSFSTGAGGTQPLATLTLTNDDSVAVPNNTAWWRADGNANDSVGTAHGTMVNGATYTAGVLGQAFRFDGLNDYMTVADPPEDYSANEISVEYWMRSATDGGVWMGQGTENVDHMNNNVWLMHPEGTDTTRFFVNDNGTWRFATTGALNDGNWHHIVGVADSTSVRVYVDGALVDTQPGISSGIRNNTASVFQAGKDQRYPAGVGRDYEGDLDEIRIYNRALTPAEVTAVFTGGAPSTPPTVVTNAAGGVGTTTATLNGSVNPNGAATDAVFEYATNATLSGATTTAVQSVGSGTSAGPVSQALSGLSAHTQYWFRASATNAGGTTEGSILSFTTGNTNPTAPNATIGGTTGDQQTYTLPYPTTDADGDSVNLVSVTPGANLSVDSTSGNQVTFTPSAGFAGSSTLAYSVNDGFGGTASGTITVNITDNDNPVVTAPANISVPSTSPAGAVVTFSPSASDNVGVTSLVSSPASGSTFPLGVTTVNITAQDAAGNTGTDSFTVEVYQAPSFYDFTSATFAAAEGNMTNTSMVVMVTRSGNTWDATSVNVVTAAGPGDAATSGTDYTAGPVAVNFAGGETTLPVSIELLGDTTVELDETIALSFASDAGATQPSTVLTVNNDDTASFSVGNPSVVEGDTGTVQLVFDVTLNDNVDTAVDVDYATADDTATLADSDYVAASGTLNFSGAAGQTLQVSVDVNGDCYEEGDEDLRLPLSNIQASGRESSITVGGSGGGGGPQAVFANVPEAGDYVLVYDLPMNNVLDWDTVVPYAIDNSASISNGSFDRIAYYLELDGNYVFVSVDAFTNDATLIGVPSTAGSNTEFQQLLSNMNVASNVPGIVTGTGIATGNIEFWKYNYGGNNAIGIPGAFPSYDFGDEFFIGGDHGSMQIHNHGAGQTLFAINLFNRSLPGEMGIGNNTGGGEQDWTLTGNGASYTSKVLQILVRPNGAGSNGVGTIVNDDSAPDVTLPGIADTTIYTSSPQATVALFPHFEDGDDPDNTLIYQVTANTDTALIQTSAVNSVDGILTLDTPCTLRGTADITVRATDPCGQFIEDTFTVTVIDDVAPAFRVKDIVVTTSPLLGEAILDPFAFIAQDKVDGPLPITCSPDGTAPFPVGVTPVSCSVSDLSGNIATAVFNVVVLLEQETPGVRYLDVVGLRGDSLDAVGLPGAEVFNVNRAFINNTGEIIYDATITGAGVNNLAVLSGPLTGPHALTALKGDTAPGTGGGVYGTYSHLGLVDGGTVSFQSMIGSSMAQFSNNGSGVTLSAIKGGAAPTGGGETWTTLQKPSLASNGTLLVTGNLSLTGGVTVFDDTVLGSASTVLAREGSPSSIPATDYGHLHPRIVSSDTNERYAFSAYLLETVFDPTDNTAVFSGTLGAGAPTAVVREGDAADGAPGTIFAAFLGEGVNSSGAVVVRANLAGAGVTPDNNEGLWTNSGNPGAPPVLVAREGEIAPCLPHQLAAFSRFSAFEMAEDGSICFHAYLKNATAAPVINSSNDGSLWRWKDGLLHLISREGDAANNTAGGVIRQITSFACSGSGALVFDVSLVPGIGDTTTRTNLAVFLDRGAGDPAPLQVLRRGDSFDLTGTPHEVVGIKLSVERNPGGGTGGYGKVINDAGEIILNLTLDQNKSGIFVLGAPPL